METALDHRRLHASTTVPRHRLELGAPAAAGLAVLLVLSVGLTDGGYYGRSTSALTVALASVAALTALLAGAARLGRAGAAMLASLVLLTGWVAASSLWAVNGAAVEPEVRRCILYTVALGAALVVVDPRRRVPFFGGLVAAITVVAIVGIGMRSSSGVSVDTYYGTLLSEPVGYPNALAVLVAMGVVLGIGLAISVDGLAGRIGRTASGFLVFVLGLTGSRGGVLALVLGLVALVLLMPSGRRATAGGLALLAIAIGGGAWAIVDQAGIEGVGLVIVGAVAVAATALAAPTMARLGGKAVALGACVLLLLVVAGIAWHPPETTSSFRTGYWSAALAELRERPALGSGAGSFYLSWREHRTAPQEVRDAHSLYIETLSELGPVGLVLVVALVTIPLGAAVRLRGDPLVATAAAGFGVFAVHAGIDWDWEMPVVTLAALGCAGAVLARPSLDREGGKR